MLEHGIKRQERVYFDFLGHPVPILEGFQVRGARVCMLCLFFRLDIEGHD